MSEGRQDASEPPLKPGTLIGRRFSVVRPLGKGGMGRVFVAEDLKTHDLVALKVMYTSHVRSASALRRFEAEAAALMGARHPNVVRCVDVGLHDTVPFIAMELVRGPSLMAHLKAHGPLGSEVALEIFRHAARGLAALHQRGVLHRDVKPSNLLLLVSEGVPHAAKWTDLGLARLGQHRITLDGLVVGTVPYMAPEQVLAEAVDPRTDVHGLGVVMYRSVTGTLPFRGDGAMQRQLAAAPTPAAELVPQIDPGLARVIHTAMKKRPENRYPSAAAMFRDLERALHIRPGAVQGVPEDGVDEYIPSTDTGRAVMNMIDRHPPPSQHISSSPPPSSSPTAQIASGH